MSCSNCYNGCTDITSDKCVKYTGLDVPILGIKTGDSLSYVEQALIEFLTSTLDGTGIEINTLTSTYCTLVSQYLPSCAPTTAVDLFSALIQAACDLQAQLTVVFGNISTIEAEIATIEANYDVKCLTDLTPSLTASSGTHDILQATIKTLCSFILTVENTYVRIADLPTYIQQYLNGQLPSNRYYAKMIPYTAVEFYPPGGDLSGFDANGVGIVGTFWEKIYICNGWSGLTPDKRGRVALGVNDGTGGGGALDPFVDPASAPPNGPNPFFALGDKQGYFNVTLDKTQMPSHNHTAVAVSLISPNPHTHAYSAVPSDGTAAAGSAPHPNGPLTLGQTGETALTVDTGVTLLYTGGGLSHGNYQPSIGCYYIMYIP